MERFRPKPSKREIFYALVDIDNRPDWCIEILEKADPKLVKKVRGLLEQGHILSEAEILLDDIPEERRLNDRDF